MGKHDNGTFRLSELSRERSTKGGGSRYARELTTPRGYFMSWGVSPILHLLYTARCKMGVKQVSNRYELGVKVDFEVSYRCKLGVKVG